MTRQTIVRLTVLFATLAIAVILFLISLQRSATSQLPPTPTVDLSATAFVASATQNAVHEATSQVSTQSAQMTLDAQATATMVAQTAEAATRVEQTARAEASLEAALSFATAQAEPIQAFLQTLASQGDILSKDGYFVRLPDFDNTWNKKGRFQWWATNFEASNFVLTANLSWDMSDPQTGKLTSGCGFIFADHGLQNQHRIFLTLDGTAHLYRLVDGLFAQVKERYYDRLEIPGSAPIALVVEDGWVSFYVNDTRVFKVEDTTVAEGDLSYAISSGTGEGYGVRCTMTEVGLWMLAD